MLIVALILLVVPILNAFMHPKNPTLIDSSLLAEPQIALPPTHTPAQKIDDSRLMMIVLVVLALGYFIAEFSKGLNFGLNIVIGLFLFIGLLAHGTLERYYRAVADGIGGITGIILLFPFYGGIMGIVTGQNANGVSIGSQVTLWFLEYANTQSFPVLAFLSAGLVNIFVPSGGGQFAVQGPIMMPAGVGLGISPEVTAMAIAWGDAWTNMMQPFWALPLLGVVGLDARAIMGYCLMVLIASGIIITGVFYYIA